MNPANPPIKAPLRRPKRSPETLLFHPRKKQVPPGGVQISASQPPARPRPVASVPTPQPTETVKTEEEAALEALDLPDTPYQEYKLMSSALNGWRYDVMKFESRKPVDISTWQTPIKLNRKEPRREERATNGAPPARGFANGKKFQKKTRQVFLVPEATRQLRKEERCPWVMEDATKSQVWTGKLEDLSKAETHAFFMPAAADVFKFVPAHRWYKFQKKPNYHVPTLEEAESLVCPFLDRTEA
jgi:transcription initiation factor TFIIF subunit alpha